MAQPRYVKPEELVGVARVERVMPVAEPFNVVALPKRLMIGWKYSTKLSKTNL